MLVHILADYERSDAMTFEPVTSPPEKSMKDLDRAATRAMLHP